ncbi:restriction endonuclease subunit S [Pontimonas sp.]|nr:restriction endonuclease subunit S [Pontimonas sp.]
MTFSQTVGDFASLESGFAFKSSDWIASGWPVVKIKNIQDGTVSLEGCGFVSEDVAAEAVAAGFKAEAGDILLSLTGYVGQAGRVSEGDQVLVNQRVGYVKAHDPAERSYVFYLLLYLKNQIEELATGTAQANVSPKDIRGLLVPSVSREYRLASAGILETLDKKISINKALSKTLEGMAQTIFKSWFIDFDPVKAKMVGQEPTGMDAETAALFPDSMEESELGKIPSGWKVNPLESVIELLDSKRVPLNRAERKARPGPYPYFGATGVLDFIDASLFAGPHVLVGEDGSVVTADGKPVVQYVWGEFWVSNHAHVLKGRRGFSVEHVKLLLENIDISNYITGAVQLKLSQQNLKSVPIVVPPQGVALAFGELLNPLFSLRRSLEDQSTIVSELRDSLLPRLISGDLKIPDEMLAA